MNRSPPGPSVHGNSHGDLPNPGDLPDPGIKPTSLMSPTLAGGFFTTGATGKPNISFILQDMFLFTY